MPEHDGPEAPTHPGGSAPHLRRLISRLHPGVSARQLSLDAGCYPDFLGHYLKPTGGNDRMPRRLVLQEIARVLSCDLADVVEAFAVDLELPWGVAQVKSSSPTVELTAEEQRALRIVRALSPADRRSWLKMGDALAGGPQ